MDTRTGEVRQLTKEESDALAHADGRNEGVHVRSRKPRVIDMGHMKPINPANLSARARRELERSGRTMVSRNSPCPCGSRKRFKRCCMTA